MSLARQRASCPVRDGHRVHFMHEGDAYLDAMLDLIAGARHEVLLEMYWFDSDEVGRRFAAALSERARAGVRVCVSYDAVGSWETDIGMFDDMRRAGCEVLVFHPVRPWMRRFRLSRLNRRNHRKLLVVDGRVGVTGGANLARQWASVARGGAGWRDDMVFVEGPVVADMRDLVVHAMGAIGGAIGGASSTASQRASSSASAAPVEVPRAAGASRVQLLENGSRKRRRAIENAYLQAIRGARERVWIVNSYFIPRLRVRWALASAVQRGVDVRVLVPAVSDVPAALHATRHLISWLLRRGVRVFEWHRSILHAKTALIDREWGTVGTHNLDDRSLRYNLEVNLLVCDPEAVERLERQLLDDFASATPIGRARWRYRPVIDRLLGAFFYRFRRFL